MKFERIAVNKLKVSVSRDDMKVWGLSFENLHENGDHIEDIFFDLMRRAEDETGFVFEDSQLLVEAMPLPGGGIVMYVTKMDGDGETVPFGRGIPVPVRLRRSRYRVKSRQTAGELVFAFDDFENLSMFVREFASFITKSDLYTMGESYYLYLTGIDNIKPEKLAALAGEFRGELCRGGAYIREHGAVITTGGDAAEKILKY